MSANIVFGLALAIGVVAGLRSMTAPAAVALAAHFGLLDLQRSPLSFMGSPAAAIVFPLMAVLEYIADLLPFIPSRTKAGPLIGRVISGGLSGACLCAAANLPVLAGAVLGGIGGVIGTFAGYEARTRLVRALKVKDAAVALAEDLVAIGAAYFIVSTLPKLF